MRFEQDKPFSPIHVVLETRDEAKIFWDIFLRLEATTQHELELRDDINNMFSNEAQL